MQRLGLAEALQRRAAAGRPILGICGGYQMLADVIDDPVEADQGSAPGLGLLAARVRFSTDKVLGRPEGSWRGIQSSPTRSTTAASSPPEGQPFLDGVRVGNIWGTIWHGAFENDAFRRAWLRNWPEQRARRGRRLKGARLRAATHPDARRPHGRY